MDEWDEVYSGHRLHYAMQRIVVAARAASLRVFDGPVADYSDQEALRRSCLIARSLGFDGKWCIHPDQIAVVNETYEEASATGSVSVDGQMVDAASIKLARNTLGKVPKKDS